LFLAGRRLRQGRNPDQHCHGHRMIASESTHAISDNVLYRLDRIAVRDGK
jgi:hypothetical protein